MAQEPGGNGKGNVLRSALWHLFGRRPADQAGPIDPENAQILARSTDPSARQRVAEDPTTAPELLYFLARDIIPTIRRAVALHPNTPRQADLLLAVDEIPEIRTIIADKVTRNIQRLRQDETSQLWQMTIAVLEALARDDVPRVRRLVAETTRSLGDLSPQLAASLSRDRIPEVALPALDYPGKIEDADLVDIVQDAPDQRVIGAVAKRPSIGPTVSDAVVEKGDIPAITTLLNNHTADIGPATLDRVVERAPPVDVWHEPLVNRPQLSDDAAVKLAGFVAEKLVLALKNRQDLDPTTTAAIDLLLHNQAPSQNSSTNPTFKKAEPVAKPTPVTGAPLGGAANRPKPGPIAPEPATAPDNPLESPLARARRYYAAGTLSEDVVIDAIGQDPDFVLAALTLRARINPAIVAKILASHSAKAMTAIAWKSGYTMRLATQLQVKLARLPPKSRLAAASGGLFPLTPEEMEWQLAFFRTLVPNV